MINPPDDRNFESLLEYLKRTRGFDFHGYKRASLMRRIDKRMQGLHIESYESYVDFLEVHPEEFPQLFNTILINVTSFFRDAAAWTFLASTILPRILTNKLATEPIRIWSAGCASGEEAYTIAILLAEAIGIEKFREHVKIYASDVDDEALGQARQALYSAREVAGMPPEYLSKYFEQVDGQYSFNRDLRRTLIFGRHDLLQDAPISRIDLLICRNALMYFNAESQTRVLSRLHFALNDDGYLFLGKAEMLFTHANLFMPFDLKRRIFTKVVKVSVRDRISLMARSTADVDIRPTRSMRFREAAFDTSPIPQIIIDANSILVLANERARNLFGLTATDTGRPWRELEFFHRLGDLRAGVEEAYAIRHSVTLKEVDWSIGLGNVHPFEIQINPLVDAADRVLGISVTFVDISRAKRLQQELEHSNQELETAYEELQSTNEELETTNEELQSTIEELETTNEELQSTNEELETINEELQSTNEELQTINEELRRRTDEQNDTNAFWGSILASMRSGVIVVDAEMLVQVWNNRAEDLWGLRSGEVQGKNFLNLDIGLPVEQLKPQIRASLSREHEFQEVTVAATNRRGKPIQCKVLCSPLLGAEGNVRGVILLMEGVDG